MTNKQTQKISKKYIIGIDPGKKSGYCLYEGGRGIIELGGGTFWDCYEGVLRHEVSEVLVLIEISDTSHIWQGKGVGYRSFGKVGMGVGGVKREGELLKEGLERLGYEVEAINPQGKVNGEFFRRITGWVGRTNQHSRDAGMLVWGRIC